MTARFEYADGRLPVVMTKGSTHYFLVYDQVGSLRAVVDSSGDIVKTVECDSSGNVIADSDAAFAVPFGFAGGRFATDTGLTRFGLRDYDAGAGWRPPGRAGPAKQRRLSLSQHPKSPVTSRTSWLFIISSALFRANASAAPQKPEHK